MLKQLPIAAAVLALAATVGAHAQANACKNKVVVANVYGHKTSATHYEYILQLRNLTKKPISWQVTFKNMPSGATVFSPQMNSSAPIAPGADATLRIGSGATDVNLNSFSIGYDTPGSAITVSNCK